MKQRYDIEIANSRQISGGYLMTTEPMTEKQLIAHVEKMGLDMLCNDRNLTGVGYWITSKDGKDLENMIHFSIFKAGHKTYVSATKNGNKIYPEH